MFSVDELRRITDKDGFSHKASCIKQFVESCVYPIILLTNFEWNETKTKTLLQDDPDNNDDDEVHEIMVLYDAKLYVVEGVDVLSC